LFGILVLFFWLRIRKVGRAEAVEAFGDVRLATLPPAAECFMMSGSGSLLLLIHVRLLAFEASGIDKPLMVFRFSRVAASVCTALAEGDFVVRRPETLHCGVIPLAEERVESLQYNRCTVFCSLSALKILLNHWVHKSIPFSMRRRFHKKKIGRDSPRFQAGVVRPFQSSRFSAKTDEIIKIKGVEPRLDIFAALGVLADILGKNGKSFGITVGTSLFHVGRPGFDFPRSTRGLGVGENPLKGFLIAYSLGQLF
jgi:hypothetical protein